MLNGTLQEFCVVMQICIVNTWLWNRNVIKGYTILDCFQLFNYETVRYN